MKARTITFAVCLLYVAVALFAGNMHHHHEGGALAPDSHCAACVWQISAHTDVPLVFTPIECHRVEIPLRSFTVEPVHVFVPFTSHSRAPPVTPA
ncbi:MAG: hypothetical protein ABSH21_12260 [Verrucomicrobiia bacterium]|jgi:hypothetical protein